jgi:hypothetical protein
MNDTKDLDFRTPLQKARAERDERIYARWIEIKGVAKNRWAAWRLISYEFGMQPQGIRGAINRYERTAIKEQEEM